MEVPSISSVWIGNELITCRTNFNTKFNALMFIFQENSVAIRVRCSQAVRKASSAVMRIPLPPPPPFRMDSEELADIEAPPTASAGPLNEAAWIAANVRIPLEPYRGPDSPYAVGSAQPKERETLCFECRVWFHKTWEPSKASLMCTEWVRRSSGCSAPRRSALRIAATSTWRASSNHPRAARPQLLPPSRRLHRAQAAGPRTRTARSTSKPINRPPRRAWLHSLLHSQLTSASVRVQVSMYSYERLLYTRTRTCAVTVRAHWLHAERAASIARKSERDTARRGRSGPGGGSWCAWDRHREASTHRSVEGATAKGVGRHLNGTEEASEAQSKIVS